MRSRVQLLRALGVILWLVVVTSYSAAGQQLPATVAGHTQIVLLGTGTPRADPQRSGPATAVVVNGTPYLVDAGPGIVRRAAAAYDKGVNGLAVANLQTAFITHLHSIEAMTKYIMLAWQVDIDVRTKGLEQRDAAGLAVQAHDVKPGLIYQDSSVKVTAFPVSHGELLAYGYRFQTSDRTVVISGDTSPSPALINSCQKCDVLIHEAFSEDYKPADMPNWLQYRQKYHTTPTQLAEIANRTEPGVLIVYHRGVGAPGREISDEQYLAEIRRTYRGRVVIGQDLDIY